MILSKLKTAAAVICAPGISGDRPRHGGTSCGRRSPEGRRKAQSEPAPSPPVLPNRLQPFLSALEVLGEEAWSLSLRDAIRIGLEAPGMSASAAARTVD